MNQPLPPPACINLHYVLLMVDHVELEQLEVVNQ